MNTLEALFSWVLTTTWQASVLALLVLAVQTALGPRLNPRWRYALWLLVLLRLLLPDLPESTLSLFRYAPAAPLNLPETISQPVIDVHPSLKNFDIPPPVFQPQPNFTFLYLALLWFSGASGLLLLTFLVNLRFARQVHRSPEITDPSLRKIFADAKAELRLRRKIRLIESPHSSSPAIMGLLTPTLLLPAGAAQRFDTRELRFIFLHELAHLKRGDVAIQALIALLQIIHWFNPVLWYAFRRLRLDREPATDALVLSRTGEAEKERYGLMLLKLLDHFNQRHSLPTLVGILEDKDHFKRRFTLIAKFTRGAYGWSLLGSIVLVVLGVACLTKAKAVPPSPAKAQSELTAAPGKDLANQLIRAVVDGDASEAKKLIDAGADPKAPQPNGQTLLFFAGSPQVAELLIQHGLDVHARDHEQNTPLHQIAWIRHQAAETLHVLLQHGADPNARDSYGVTPLMNASDAAAVDVLVDAGGDVNAHDNEGTPVIEHFSAANVGKLKELFKLGARFDAKTDGPTMLILAAHNGDLQIISYLLGLGVDPNAKGTWNKEAGMYERPLECAVTSGRLDAAQALIAHGAKIDPMDLQNALVNNRKEILRFFWQHGARSITELTYRISQGAPAADIQRLLDSGASPNPPQDSPISPLDLAAQLGRLDLVQLLVQHGAVLNPASTKQNDIWNSPIDDAAFEGQDEVVAYLLLHGAKTGYQALWNVAWNVNPYPGEQRSKDHFEKTLKLLIDAGALNGLTPEQKGRLLDAVIDTRNPGGNATALKMLLAAGLSPNLPETDTSGKNYGTILSTYRDYRTQNPSDPRGIFPLITLLEAADKPAPPSSTSTASASPSAASAATTAESLMALRLDLPACSSTPLGEVVESLTGAIRQADPARQGLGFVVPRTPSTQSARLTLDAMKSVTVADAVNEIAKAANLTYALEDGILYLRPADSGNSVLSVRTFLVPVGFFKASAMPQTHVEAELLAHGIAFTGDSSAVYLSTLDKLVVRDTPDELDKLQVKLEAATRQWPDSTLRAGNPSASTDPPTPAAPPAFVRIEMKLVEIKDDVYRAHKSRIDAAVDNGDFLFLDNLAGVSALSAPTVTTMAGLKANIDIVRELPYPTSFEPGKIVTHRTVSTPGGSLTNMTLVIPPTPREFATKDVGVSAEITPTINPADSPAPGKIVLDGRVSLTDFDGFTPSNVTGAQLPSFTTSESNFIEQMDDHQPKAVWLPGQHVDETPLVIINGTPKAPPLPATQRLLLFVTATREP